MELRDFLNHLEGVQQTNDGHMARCPAHEDKKPSLSIAQSPDGKILLNCHAGCKAEAIVGAVKLSMADLFPEKAATNGKPVKATIVSAYDYRDEKGKPVFQVCRMSPKDFRQRRPDPQAVDGWTWKTKGVRRVVYRLPEILTAIGKGEVIYIAEGEKDVEALVKQGLAATCNAGGAGKWKEEHTDSLRMAQAVVIIADKDPAGRAHADAVAVYLRDLVKSVKRIELPDLNGKAVKDAHDFFALGGTLEQLAEIVTKTPEYVPKANLTPNHWFNQRFPTLAEKHGEPVNQKVSASGRTDVLAVSEDFMAATLSEEATPESPTIYLPTEDRFLTYAPQEGIYRTQRDEGLSGILSSRMLACARDCRESADVSKLEFQLRNTSALSGVVKRAKSLLAVPHEFFEKDIPEFIPVANGMLRLSDRTLLPFSPSYRCRHKLAVKFEADAYCPLFMDTLLRPALEMDDVALIQQFGGLALLGVNLSQKILLMTGTAGGGKSTFVSVITGIIGQDNVGTLRPELLRDRFELGRLLSKTLLYGADVTDSFLNAESASMLKSLTGGDMLTGEFKNSNESPQIRGRFNVIVTSNSRLSVYLEGDADAWRRRLAIVRYQKAKPDKVIPNLSQKIITEEGSGILNFLLDGLDMLRLKNWELTLNNRQQQRVDDLLLESESALVFAREKLIKDTSQQIGLPMSDAYLAYMDFCTDRGWEPSGERRFLSQIRDAVAVTFGFVVRHDIRGADGKLKRGWMNLRLKTASEDSL